MGTRMSLHLWLIYRALGRFHERQFYVKADVAASGAAGRLSRSSRPGSIRTRSEPLRLGARWGTR